MKTYILTLALLVAFHLGSLGYATHYEPEVLEQILQQTEAAAIQGLKPVLVFDLDDTLIDTRNRNQRILRDFSFEPEIAASFPNETKVLKNVAHSKIRYELADTFSVLGINNPDLFAKAQKYWQSRFFSNAYVAEDAEVLGGATYVNWVEKAGGFVVYLTGRDLPRMELGTRQNLTELGFPMGSHTALLMKPNKDMDDLSYKKSAFKWISQQGTVIAGFENEPANLNAFQAEWPKGTMVFLDTIHSNKPVEPNPGTIWIENFLNRRTR